MFAMIRKGSSKSMCFFVKNLYYIVRYMNFLCFEALLVKLKKLLCGISHKRCEHSCDFPSNCASIRNMDDITRASRDHVGPSIQCAGALW